MSLAAIQKGLEAGHESLSLLRACVAKSRAALDRLGVILQSIIVQAKERAAIQAKNDLLRRPPSQAKLNLMAHEERAMRKDLHQSSPDGPAVFKRPKPLSEITWSRRKVPKYIITSGIPVLKYPGPQPVLMNRVIRQKWKRNNKRQEKIKLLDEDREFAANEDNWDLLVKKFGMEDIGDRPNTIGGGVPGIFSDDAFDRGSWQDSFTLALYEYRAAHRREETRSKEFGERLYNVLKEERDLRERERREAKHERRMERKRAQAEVILSAGIDEGSSPNGTT